MAKTIVLDVVTPSKPELHKDVEYVVAPTVNGVVGILPGHIRLITQLATGVLRYQSEGRDYFMAVSEGFMEVTPYKVVVLAEAAELAENIDAEQALEEKRRAEELLHHSLNDKINFTRAEIGLERAVAKLEIAKKNGEVK
jgi:ATP synthase, F1 epsilon subunit (delta in mitochondria)